MEKFELVEADSSDKTMVILQSLLCLMREKNMLSRGDIEDLCRKVQTRAADHAHDPIPCCADAATAAASEMAQLGGYIGKRYGGKHRRF